jgi:replicative DNA helicase
MTPDETYILGSCLCSTDCFIAASGAGLTDIHFSTLPGKAAWLAQKAAFLRFSSTELSIVATSEKNANMAELVALASQGGAMSELMPIKARLVIEAWKRREAHAILAHASILAKGQGEEFPETWNSISSLINRLVTIATDADDRNFSQMVDSYIDQRKNPNTRRSISTGWPSVDRLFGQPAQGELITVAARPGCGKSALAILLAHASASKDHKTVIFSAEMSGEEIIDRMVCFTGGPKAKHDLQHGIDAAQKLQSLAGRLHVFDDLKPHSVGSIESRCRALAASERGLGCIIIDYVGLIEPENRRDVREQQVASITRRMKSLAASLRCPVVLLCQMNRDIEKDGKSRAPRLSDLRESGSIEQDSNRVWFLYDDPKFLDSIPAGAIPDKVHILLLQAKCRGGKSNIAVRMEFDKPLYRMTPIADTASTF